jgi:hypothetical protein
MKLQRHCIYTSKQHENLNRVPLRWEPENLVCRRSPWLGRDRDVNHPWIGLAAVAMTHRDATGRLFAVPKGAEFYHWEERGKKFVAWRSGSSGSSGGRTILRELCE